MGFSVSFTNWFSHRIQSFGVYRGMMDPEPGRCRRTDGKKWRCGKDVIPDQKYCEQHMHRGRGRSRKLVEASEITSESGNIKITHKINGVTTAISFSDISDTINYFSSCKSSASNSLSEKQYQQF